MRDRERVERDKLAFFSFVRTFLSFQTTLARYKVTPPCEHCVKLTIHVLIRLN